MYFSAIREIAYSYEASVTHLYHLYCSALIHDKLYGESLIAHCNIAVNIDNVFIIYVYNCVMLCFQAFNCLYIPHLSFLWQMSSIY